MKIFYTGIYLKPEFIPFFRSGEYIIHEDPTAYANFYFHNFKIKTSKSLANTTEIFYLSSRDKLKAF